MNKRASLTIGIITKDRPQFLKICLENKYRYINKSVHILVSDDSFNKENIKKNKILCKQFHVQYLKGPQRGLYSNRNNIMNNIKTSHLLTCDDDHLYPENFINLIFKEIDLHIEDILVIGEVKINNKLKINNYMPKYINALGRIVENTNPDSLSGISCGSTIYPSTFIKKNIRCDEAYLFGRIWYLYSLQILKNSTFNIRFVTSTSIEHNTVSSQDRKSNIKYLKHQQECNLYVSFVHAFYFAKNILCFINLFWKIIILLIIGRTIHGNKDKIKIGLRAVIRVIKNTYKNKDFYQKK